MEGFFEAFPSSLLLSRNREWALPFVSSSFPIFLVPPPGCMAYSEFLEERETAIGRPSSPPFSICGPFSETNKLSEAISVVALTSLSSFSCSYPTPSPQVPTILQPSKTVKALIKRYGIAVQYQGVRASNHTHSFHPPPREPPCTVSANARSG